ncbi:hypothetical protein KEH51_15710 [[Brevibacterium] frigoritolerans]|uniref:Uncharacterized protein n=1 Tax=Peribacillus frigoritolerans TaxID=450367 RepID=A0A941J7Y0_9BACI|nr:hypothetical protein [Peribacillus frigoritolerans]
MVTYIVIPCFPLLISCILIFLGELGRDDYYIYISLAFSYNCIPYFISRREKLDIRDIKKIISNIKSFFRLKNEHLWIFVIGFIVLGIILTAQYKFGVKNPNSFITSLLPNFFADVISVLVTTFLVTHLLQKNQERKRRMIAYATLGRDFNTLMHTVANRYIWYITKDKAANDVKDEEIEESEEEIHFFTFPFKFPHFEQRMTQNVYLPANAEVDIKDYEYNNEKTNRVREVVKSVDTFIGKDFISTDYKSIEPYGEDGKLKIREIAMDYVQFCEIFRDRTVEDINEFKSTYDIGILVPELADEILKLEKYFNSGVLDFSEFRKRDYEYNLKEAKIEVTQFREMFFKMGLQIISMMEFFKKEEGEIIKKL